MFHFLHHNSVPRCLLLSVLALLPVNAGANPFGITPIGRFDSAILVLIEARGTDFVLHGRAAVERLPFNIDLTIEGADFLGESKPRLVFPTVGIGGPLLTQKIDQNSYFDIGGRVALSGEGRSTADAAAAVRNDLGYVQASVRWKLTALEGSDTDRKSINEVEKSSTRIVTYGSFRVKQFIVEAGGSGWVKERPTWIGRVFLRLQPGVYVGAGADIEGTVWLRSVQVAVKI